ncbi:hypothetical protein AVEN_132799-1 [Araneus ventricosus]|uniref:Uncharacterized protein n=1 Tax=Araneus ventricosus TaxID=182803 RepID=A0A4Y2BMR3_ARAVE|nr:hypothetical protein AVEN_132799-1 [Araneus ventricosus]
MGELAASTHFAQHYPCHLAASSLSASFESLAASSLLLLRVSQPASSLLLLRVSCCFKSLAASSLSALVQHEDH